MCMLTTALNSPHIEGTVSDIVYKAEMLAIVR